MPKIKGETAFRSPGPGVSDPAGNHEHARAENRRRGCLLGPGGSDSAGNHEETMPKITGETAFKCPGRVRPEITRKPCQKSPARLPSCAQVPGGPILPEITRAQGPKITGETAFRVPGERIRPRHLQMVLRTPIPPSLRLRKAVATYVVGSVTHSRFAASSNLFKISSV